MLLPLFIGSATFHLIRMVLNRNVSTLFENRSPGFQVGWNDSYSILCGFIKSHVSLEGSLLPLLPSWELLSFLLFHLHLFIEIACCSCFQGR